VHCLDVEVEGLKVFGRQFLEKALDVRVGEVPFVGGEELQRRRSLVHPPLDVGHEGLLPHEAEASVHQNGGDVVLDSRAHAVDESARLEGSAGVPQDAAVRALHEGLVAVLLQVPPVHGVLRPGSELIDPRQRRLGGVGRMPRDGQHQVDAQVDRDDIGHEIPVAPDGPEDALACAGDEPRGPVDVVHPPWQRLPQRRRHYGGPDDGHRQVLGELGQEGLRECFGQRVGVRSLAQQLRGYGGERRVVQEVDGVDELLGVVRRVVEFFSDVVAVAVGVGGGHVDEGHQVPHSAAQLDESPGPLDVHGDGGAEGLVEADRGGGVEHDGHVVPQGFLVGGRQPQLWLRNVAFHGDHLMQEVRPLRSHRFENL